jgi:hypothetical protein
MRRRRTGRVRACVRTDVLLKVKKEGEEEEESAGCGNGSEVKEKLRRSAAGA